MTLAKRLLNAGRPSVYLQRAGKKVVRVTLKVTSESTEDLLQIADSLFENGWNLALTATTGDEIVSLTFGDSVDIQTRRRSSPSRADASRRNGARGGRPKKSLA